jgi:hypothetical protein
VLVSEMAVVYFMVTKAMRQRRSLFSREIEEVRDDKYRADLHTEKERKRDKGRSRGRFVGRIIATAQKTLR